MIVDGNDGWIFNYEDKSFTKQTLTVTSTQGTFDLIPGYVSYHNSFFLVAPSRNEPNDTNTWYAFQRATDTTISQVTDSAFPLQTKPDKCRAVKRLPGRGNHVLVIGNSVCEVWTNVGGSENYRRNSSFNIDYGTVAPETIAANEEFLCFLAQNENNAPTILVTNGGEVKPISTDGIDHLLQSIKFPEKSTAFFYRQDGHLFYQITFYSEADNLTLFYDFKTQKFYHASDQNFNFHPARQVIYFNERFIFVGINRGSIYELSTNIIDVIEEINDTEGEEIPRLRIPDTVRLSEAKPFVCTKFEFWLEQGINNFPKIDTGEDNCLGHLLTESGDFLVTESGAFILVEDGYCIEEPNRPRVDLALSKNGNQSFSPYVGIDLNPEGVYRNRTQWNRLGFANEITFQIRFWGLQRFIANNGILYVNR